MQKPNLILLISLLAITLMVFGCGPSAEEITAMTQAAWTPTPPPIPFDLDLTVENQDGFPVPGATVEVNGGTANTDENGMVSWENLPSGSVTLSITASGYFPNKITESIERGENQLTATLEMDPDGLLPENACTPSETLLYIDDFQSGVAKEWDSIEGGTPGWTVESSPDNSDDLVVAARVGANLTFLRGENDYNYNNSVWRLRFKQVGNGSAHINFRWVDNESRSIRYFLSLNQQNANLVRWERPDNHLDVGSVDRIATDQWHLLEFSYFDGTASVYLDGKEGATWTDPQPWEGGTINLEPYPEGEGVLYFDDFSVCGLSAPFEPIPRPKTGYNLSVNLNDSEGSPIPQASITVVEMGELDEAAVVTGEIGSASWSDVPGADITLAISAPGYFYAEEQVSIEKGDNQLSFALERDEYGKLPTEICRSDENLLYAEDIQDGVMQGWDTLTSMLELNVPGLAIIPEPELEGNQILEIRGQGDNTHSNQMGYEKKAFGDAALRFDAKGFSNLHYIVRWHAAKDRSEAYYAFIYGGNERGGRIEKNTSDNFVQVISWSKNIGDGKWHTFEISTHQGEFQIWIDGSLMGKWTDPQYFEEGYFTIEHDFWKGDAIAYYDNFSVCQLDAPFVSIFSE